MTSEADDDYYEVLPRCFGCEEEMPGETIVYDDERFCSWECVQADTENKLTEVKAELKRARTCGHCDAPAAGALCRKHFDAAVAMVTGSETP